MIKAIAVDMDGTFLNTNKTYDEERFERIFKQLKARNIKLIAASGNQYAKLKSIFGERDMYFVAENGAVIYEGHNLYDYQAFDRDFYQQVIDYLNIEQGVNNLIICGLSSAYILKENTEAFKKDAHFYYRQLEEIDSLQDLPKDDYVKIAFNINRETHPTLDQDLKKHFNGKLETVSSGHDSIDIIIPGITKGQALKRLLNIWQLDAANLMAFGDANNDLDMLQLAKHSYVMENSEDEMLFEVANHVAPSNDNQGVLSVIETEVLNKSL
ncbi:Cof-type HAD-IIB family hydrolase [Staphylococcus edaphicus]|uniref:Cof-type HAD-IIB family hydrolase n=1 Tax=Staphylococcus edaphicus TaxID=1955013 RepID=A0A2C6WNK6_9STAP|nr:Cof-type HAD-IIB family hydrolase [Staphylococcus edaphicus]PHK49655.1 HAD family hydrolase [Staphylococcus edaphicus]UQW81923.1 Cof-type HAD-IIB family hydrolase [Staphylococcus edaphicus]